MRTHYRSLLKPVINLEQEEKAIAYITPCCSILVHYLSSLQSQRIPINGRLILARILNFLSLRIFETYTLDYSHYYYLKMNDILTNFVGSPFLSCSKGHGFS